MARPLKLTFHGTILLVTLAVLIAMAAVPARQAYEQRKRIEQETARLSALKSENLELEKRLKRLNDPDYIEKLAREELGLVRPGEVSYVIVPGPTQTSEADPEPKDDRSWWRRTADWLAERI